MTKRWKPKESERYIAHYECGCTEGAFYKKDLLEYCGKHGSDLMEIIKTTSVLKHVQKPKRVKAAMKGGL